MMSVQALSRFFNLGIDDWEPEPIEKVISYDAKEKTLHQVLEDIILKTYDIRLDDTALREEVSKFEYLRGNYPVRREFHAYHLKITNLKSEDKTVLQRLGFKII